jgi:hypothetical protein
MLFQHPGDRLLGASIITDRRSGSCISVSPSCTACQGRPGRSRPPLPFDHADAADHVVDQLVAAAEASGATDEP